MGIRERKCLTATFIWREVYFVAVIFTFDPMRGVWGGELFTSTFALFAICFLCELWIGVFKINKELLKLNYLGNI